MDLLIVGLGSLKHNLTSCRRVFWHWRKARRKCVSFYARCHRQVTFIPPFPMLSKTKSNTERPTNQKREFGGLKHPHLITDSCPFAKLELECALRQIFAQSIFCPGNAEDKISGDFGTGSSRVEVLNLLEAVYLSLQNRCPSKGDYSLADVNGCLDELNLAEDRHTGVVDSIDSV